MLGYDGLELLVMLKLRERERQRERESRRKINMVLSDDHCPQWNILNNYIFAILNCVLQ